MGTNETDRRLAPFFYDSSLLGFHLMIGANLIIIYIDLENKRASGPFTFNTDDLNLGLAFE